MAAAQHPLVRAHPYSRDTQLLLACANTVHLLQQGDGYLRAPSPSWTHACAQQAKCTTEFVHAYLSPKCPTDGSRTCTHTRECMSSRLVVAFTSDHQAHQSIAPYFECLMYVHRIIPPNAPPSRPLSPPQFVPCRLPCASTLYHPVIPSTNAPTPSIHPTT
jgi:hypothetical protein